MNAIEIRNLTKSYQDFTLGPLELTLPMGCIIGLVGENGAGKSTTIKLILDMIHRDGGEISILGCDNRTFGKEDLGVVLDEAGISGFLNPTQVGKVMAGIYKNWDQALFEEYLRRFSLPEKKKFKEFSRGMKMKLGIAVALSHHPKLLILDEATSGLDPVVRDEIVDIFGEFTRDENHAVLMSSHIVSDLEKICDYIAFLHKGKLLLMEEKDTLREQYGLLRCSKEEYDRLPQESVMGKKVTAYGVEALVRRDMVVGLPLSTVDVEQLFLFMVREAN